MAWHDPYNAIHCPEHWNWPRSQRLGDGAYEQAHRTNHPTFVRAAMAGSLAAQTVLGWSAHRTLEEMCRDGWAWQQANPMTMHDDRWDTAS